MEREFRIDLTAIEGDGEFCCPTCGATISPDDYSGTIYEVLYARTREDGAVEGIVLQCSGCRSTICLDGFDLLESIVCSMSEEGLVSV